MTLSNNVERVVYDEWRGNFRTKLRKIGTNNREYTCINMQVYDSGILGVRPWDKTFAALLGTVSGAELEDNAWMAPRDDSSFLGSVYIYEYQGAVWNFDFSAGTWASDAGIYASMSASDDRAEYWGVRHDWTDGQRVGSSQYSDTPDDDFILGGQAHDTSAGVTTTLNHPDAAGALTNFVIYRDRVWLWGPTGVTTSPTDPANRLFFSDAASYTSFTAGNFLDVGAASDDQYILGAWAVRDSLLICMSNGDWYAFTGTPGSGSLRFIGNSVTPPHGAAGTVFNNAVWFLSPYGRGVCVATPAGVDSASLSHIRPWAQDFGWDVFVQYRALSSEPEQAMAFPVARSETQNEPVDMVEFVNGEWTLTSLAGDMDNDAGFASNINVRDFAVIAQKRAYAYVTTETYSEFPYEAVLINTRDIVLNRPSHGGDLLSDGGGPGGIVRLAPWSPEGQRTRVRQVIVDFHYWSDDAAPLSGGYATPDMEVVLKRGGIVTEESIDTFDGAALPTFEDLSITNTGDHRDSVHGLPSRAVFRFNIDDVTFENTYQVEINTIQSIAIDRIIVDYEIEPDNHWAGQVSGT